MKGKFLDVLHNNAFSGINVEDAVEHIEYFLKIVDPIDLPNVHRIENEAKTMTFGYDLAMFTRFSRSKRSREKSSSTPLERARDFEGKNGLRTGPIKIGPDQGPSWSKMPDRGPDRNGMVWSSPIRDDEQELSEIFRIETNLFDYETPLCEKFKEFNYLLKIDSDVLTNDIVGFKTYDKYKDDWIYKWNKNVPWVHKKPWTDTGVWTEPTPVVHCCKPFNYKNRCSWWPTCSWREDGYCNGENLPGAYIVGNTLRYQDLEWYDALKDSELKEEVLRNKVIMEGLINEDVDSNDEDYERHELCGNETHELPVCNIRFEMIKYSFGQDEEPPLPPAGHHHAATAEDFSARFFRRTQKGSPPSDLLDPAYYSPSRASPTYTTTTTAATLTAAATPPPPSTTPTVSSKHHRCHHPAATLPFVTTTVTTNTTAAAFTIHILWSVSFVHSKKRLDLGFQALGMDLVLLTARGVWLVVLQLKRVLVRCGQQQGGRRGREGVGFEHKLGAFGWADSAATVGVFVSWAAAEGGGVAAVQQQGAAVQQP
nr:hypothetical protein [Tanacetum cinerariifolium]